MILLLFLALQLACASEPHEEVLVEAPRLLDESVEASRSVTLIDEHEIRLRNSPTVADLLSSLPGVTVIRQGPIGQPTSILLRGARSEDTLVLIDGVEANDAMSPAGGYDFSSLSPENIERIEVYRGPQSVRFGGGALGGVINIVSKEGRGPLGAHYGLEGGSYSTSRAQGGLAGGAREFNYSLAADGWQSKGFSAAAVQDGNSEPDGAKMGSASGKLIWRPSSSSSINATLRYMKSNTDLDRHGGPGGDDPNYVEQSSQFLAGLSGEHRFFSNRLKSTLGFYYSEVNRSDTNLPDAFNLDHSYDSFLSEKQKIDSNHEFSIDEHNTFRLNLQWQSESAASTSIFDGTENDVSRNQQSDLGEGLTYLYESQTWFWDLGFRMDEHSVVGSIPSERASLGRSFGETRVSLTYGSGFKPPSLYQLYSVYGVPSLHAESSETWELTAEQKFSAQFAGSVAFFKNQYRNMIDFDTSTSRYLNISSVESSGVEVQASYLLWRELKLDANYTYLSAIDRSTGLALLRRPRQSANLGLRFADQTSEAFSEIRYEDARADSDPVTFARTTDPAFVVVNVGGAYRILPALKITGRVENVFNKKYVEVAGYGTPGFSYYLGLRGEI